MTLFFNLLNLEKRTKGDPKYLVEALHMYYKNIKIPRSIFDRYKPVNIGFGYSFLLHPGKLFADKSTDDIHKAQYIKLAGRRDYLNYKVTKSTNLDCSFFPDLNIQALQFNPLIKIIDTNKIQFKYEDK